MTMWRKAARVVGLFIVLAMAVLFISNAANALTHTRSAVHQTGRVVLVGISGLRWDDPSPTGTPNLWRLVEDGASASLSVRAVHRHTCPMDGWLTLNAGNQAAGPRAQPADDPSTPCPAVPQPVVRMGGVVAVPGFDALPGYNKKVNYVPSFGLLHAVVYKAGHCATAVGPGAAVALADSAGQLNGTYYPSVDTVDETSLERCTLTVIDLGSVPDQPVSPNSRAQRVHTIDRRLGRLMAELPEETTLIVAGLADTGPQPHLRLVVAAGPAFPPVKDGPSRLTSSSTRQEGLATLTDLTPTLLREIGAPLPPVLAGSPLSRTLSSATSVEALARGHAAQDTAAQVIQRVVPGFLTGLFSVLVVGQLVVYLTALVVLRRRLSNRRQRIHLLVQFVALTAAAASVATFLASLVPWWRSAHPMVALSGLVAGIAPAIAVLATSGPWRRGVLGPVGFVALLTAAVLALDVMTSSRLQQVINPGFSPLLAGRFYGLANVAFAFFAIAALVTTAWFIDRWIHLDKRHSVLGIVVSLGAITTVIDGWPSLGADFGGVLALVPAFAVLALLISGARISPLRLGIVGVAAVLTVVFFAVADWLRPTDQQTHLGRFVQQVVDGQATAVLRRKIAANLGSFATNRLSYLIPLVFILLAVILWRPERVRASGLAQLYQQAPVFRAGLIAMYVAAVVGFAVNDSGVVVPAVMLSLAGPLTVAAIAAAARIDTAQPPAVQLLAPELPHPADSG